jgi:hypothetical protein
MSRFRRTKKDVRAILLASNWQDRLIELEQWAPIILAPPLFSLRLDKDEAVRWRAVTAFGLTADRMAKANMEKARVLMRTCMWHMNEESGNLGWGIPHFMGEAMAKNSKIAKEFHKILVSYVFCDSKCDGNFLDHPELRRDVFWGLARLAENRPELVAHGERFLLVALEDSDPYNRAYAARVLGLIKSNKASNRLNELKNDPTEISTFLEGKIVNITVGKMISDAIKAIG